MKKILKIAGIVLGILLVVVLAYVAYLIVTYHRIEDNQQLEIVKAQAAGEQEAVQVGEEYTILTYNIGFGAYTPEFSFFMDGGTSSWAESEESVKEAVNGAADLMISFEPDFVMVQEVDLDSTRSYHINQYEMLSSWFPEYDSAFAVNYDSAFLAYPFTEPHGKSNSGLVLYSRIPIAESLRRSFPISTSFSKFFDLDRCYSISRIPVENGKELVLITLHMSAYGNSDAVRQGQIQMLCEDMKREYEKGNYVICGGDFNHDLKALEDDGSERESWAYPFPRESLPEHFRFCIDSFSDEERATMWDSARNADMAYVPGETYTVTLDGFIISDNIECVKYENIETGYRFSDHEPVVMKFRVK